MVCSLVLPWKKGKEISSEILQDFVSWKIDLKEIVDGGCLDYVLGERHEVHQGIGGKEKRQTEMGNERKGA